jgi:hypothetical protein
MSEIADLSQEVEFSVEEARVLKGIVQREAILRDLAASVVGLEALNTVASMVIRGPVKVAFEWNKGLIEGWKKANGHIGKIARSETCKDINLMWVDATSSSENYRFWSNLKEVQGC